MAEWGGGRGRGVSPPERTGFCSRPQAARACTQVGHLGVGAPWWRGHYAQERTCSDSKQGMSCNRDDRGPISGAVTIRELPLGGKEGGVAPEAVFLELCLESPQYQRTHCVHLLPVHGAAPVETRAPSQISLHGPTCGARVAICEPRSAGRTLHEQFPATV